MKEMPVLGAAIRLVGLLGLVLFGTAFAVTFVSPIYFEQAGKAFVQNRIEAEVRAKIQSLPAHLPATRAMGILSQRFQTDAAALQKKLEDRLPEKVADVIAQMLDLDCDCREKLGRTFRDTLEWRLTSLAGAQARLYEIIEGKYVQIVQKLLRELRIFSGCNAVAFLCLVAVSLRRKASGAQLLIPATLLLISTLVCAGFYLFEQNWFFTILFDDYLGYGYAAYLALVFLFLWDVSLNGARITGVALDGVGSVVTGLFSWC